MKYLQSLEELEGLVLLLARYRKQEAQDEVVLHQAVRFATEETDSSIGFISVVDYEDETYLHSTEQYVISRAPGAWRYNRGFRLPIGNATELPRNRRSLSGHAAYTRKPYRCGNVKRDVNYMAVDDAVLSELVVPIEHRKTLLGVMNLESYQLEFYTEEHEHFLCHIAALIAAPLARLRAHKTKEHAEELAMKDFATLCQPYPSTSHEFLSAVLQRIAGRMKVSRGVARTRDKEQLVFSACYPQKLLESRRLQSLQDLFLPIGADALREKPSWAGSIAQTRQPRRVSDIQTDPDYLVVDKTMRSALGAPILFGDNLLGVINLAYKQKAYYTAWHEQYLLAFVQRIAAHLHVLQTSEKRHTSRKAVHKAITDALAKRGTNGPSPRTAHVIAEQVAKALDSRLCTLWFLDSRGDLAWYGAFGIPLAPPPQGTEQSCGEAARAIHDAFGIRPAAFSLGLRARSNTIGWMALSQQETQNCGPNRDPTFFHKGYVQPFLITPLISYDMHVLGGIHVGLKQGTSANPHGFYSEADEHLLASLQIDIMESYERQQLREISKSVAQDLHDALGLVTRDLLYGIDRAQSELRQPDLLRAGFVLQDMARKTQTLMREIRGIMEGLDSRILEEMELIPMLRHFLSMNVQQPTLTAKFVLKRQIGHLPIGTTWQLYRIAQEALTNVIRHAGASEVECGLDMGPTQVTLYVRDNGQGYKVSPQRYTERHGLRNMRRRVESLEGALHLHSEPGKGTTVTVVIPREGSYATATF
jgi:signal transduction histidine kinase